MEHRPRAAYFAFSMFSDIAGIVPALTTDTAEGLTFIVNVNPDGSTTVTDYSDENTRGAAGRCRSGTRSLASCNWIDFHRGRVSTAVTSVEQVAFTLTLCPRPGRASRFRGGLYSVRAR